MRPEQFVERLDAVKRTSVGWQARCPAHDDRQASLSVSEGTDGRTLIKCHAGCAPKAIVGAVGLKMSDLFTGNGNTGAASSLKRITAAYDYCDEDGVLLFQVVRFEPKGFSQRRPDPVAGDGWSWSVKGVRRVPFRLPGLLQAVADQRTVFIAEGEKDCLALAEVGFAATCNAGGAGKWCPEFAGFFRNAHIIVIADKDAPGRKHAQQVAASLHAVAASVRVIEVPDVNEHVCKDAADYFGAGGEAADLDEIAQAAPLWTPRGVHEIEISRRNTLEQPCAEVRGELLRVLTSDLSPDQKRSEAARVVVAGLGRMGRFYYHAERRDFETATYFNATSKHLERIRSDAFQSWLSFWLSVNRADPVFRYIQHEVETAALSGPDTTGIVPEAYWAGRFGAIYLSNGDGQMVKITADGIRTVDNGTDRVLFPAGMTLSPWQIVEPDDCFKTCRLFSEARTNDPAGRNLLQLWIYSLPTSPRNKPPLCATGDVGSGKTRLMRGIAELFGLPFIAAKLEESGEDHFWPNVDSGGLYVLDNADTRCCWLPDALSAAATDGCSRRRKLYTNNEMVTLRANAWIGITSANPTFAADAGLADRLLVVRMARRDGETSDSALSAEILRHRDASLSHLVATLQVALADTVATPSGLNDRHPDFAAFAVRIGRALGREAEAVAALRNAEADKSRFCLENDTIGSALLQFLQAGEFDGTAQALAAGLQETDPDLRDRLSAKRLGRRLAALWPHVTNMCQPAEKKRTAEGTWFTLGLKS